MNNIGQKIKKLRQENNISQEVLSFELGVARQTVSKWEVGSMQPTTENIKALCDYFGVEADYFLSDTYTKTPDREQDDQPVEETSTAESAATVANNNHKKKKVILLVGIIASTFVFIISLMIGIIATVINQEEDKGFETVSRLEFDWSNIVYFVIALIALITLIVLLVFRKIKKNK